MVSGILNDTRFLILFGSSCQENVRQVPDFSPGTYFWDLQIQDSEKDVSSLAEDSESIVGLRKSGVDMNWQLWRIR